MNDASPLAESPGEELSSVPLRVKFFLTGVAFPLIGLVAVCCGIDAVGEEPWQSGQLIHYVALLLQWPAIAAFIPLVTYSMICLAIWVAKPSCARWFFVRLGIYSGGPLALQFLLFFLCTSTVLTLIAALIVGPLLALTVHVAKPVARRAKRYSIRDLLILTTVCALLSALFRYSSLFRNLTAMLFFLVLGATPTLNVITYVRASFSVHYCTPAVQRRPHGWHALGWLSFLAAWAAAWKMAVDTMLVEYAKLPTTDPNCYVGSAAAHGHRRFVGVDAPTSGPVLMPMVNMQMRRLKFMEMALIVACPRLHLLIRRGYDRIGPPLAQLCRRNVWFADATYVILKPLEYLAECIRVAACISGSRVRALYRVQAAHVDRP